MPDSNLTLASNLSPSDRLERLLSLATGCQGGRTGVRLRVRQAHEGLQKRFLRSGRGARRSEPAILHFLIEPRVKHSHTHTNLTRPRLTSGPTAPPPRAAHGGALPLPREGRRLRAPRGVRCKRHGGVRAHRGRGDALRRRWLVLRRPGAAGGCVVEDGVVRSGQVRRRRGEEAEEVRARLVAMFPIASSFRSFSHSASSLVASWTPCGRLTPSAPSVRRQGSPKVIAGAPLWQWGAAGAGCLLGVGWIYRRPLRRELRARFGVGGRASVRVRALPPASTSV